jgi:hypothetical protein
MIASTFVFAHRIEYEEVVAGVAGQLSMPNPPLMALEPALPVTILANSFLVRLISGQFR